ncbi:phosphomevalonate kinase [Periophthalmus magnuspinnatus]|uniref:phosphomevalonate kinase n=1 Tax=Periophthalmus magnuspinnatus TaxID=409849 RepID=UPI00145AB915|nr:phosphomevalonate kinase [Periophthalmus magnuspinnatus]
MEKTDRTGPVLVLVFSGKRKSGKDHVTDLLQARLGTKVSCIVRLSGPLKQQFAQNHGLDLNLLLGTGPYKEQFRSQMIQWGEAQRRSDPGFFCRLATRDATQPVWLVSDARRISDLAWFQTQYPAQSRFIRVQCSDQTRTSRGWSFTAGVDDAESECGLDSGVEWDWIISNEGDPQDLKDQLRPVIDLALKAGSEPGPNQD